MTLNKGVNPSKHETVLAPSAGKFINVLGDNQTVKLASEQTSGLFAMMEQNNEAGVRVPVHVHTREDEMFYVCEGEMTFTVGDKEGLCSGGASTASPATC